MINWRFQFTLVFHPYPVQGQRSLQEVMTLSITQYFMFLHISTHYSHNVSSTANVRPFQAKYHVGCAWPTAGMFPNTFGVRFYLPIVFVSGIPPSALCASLIFSLIFCSFPGLSARFHLNPFHGPVLHLPKSPPSAL